MTTAENKKKTAAWRSSSLYASGWKIHDFASPPRDGFAFIDTLLIIVLSPKKASGQGGSGGEEKVTAV
jgi:hypothetical protein